MSTDRLQRLERLEKMNAWFAWGFATALALTIAGNGSAFILMSAALDARTVDTSQFAAATHVHDDSKLARQGHTHPIYAHSAHSHSYADTSHQHPVYAASRHKHPVESHEHPESTRHRRLIDDRIDQLMDDVLGLSDSEHDHDYEQSGTLGRLRVRRLSIVDELGNPVILLGQTDGNGVIAIADRNGDPLVTLTSLYDPDSMKRLGKVSINGADGVTTVLGTSILVTTNDAKAALSVGMTEKKRGVVWIQDPKGVEEDLYLTTLPRDPQP